MYKIIGADQKEYGPVTAEQLRMWIRDGRVNAQTLARSEAGGDWQPVGNFPELADAFGAPAAAPGTAPGMPPSPMGAVSAPFASNGSRDAALSAVKGPAIALLVVGAMGVAFYIFGALNNFIVHAAPQPMPQNLPPEWQSFWQSMQNSRGPLGGLMDLFFAAMSGLVLFGAIRMMRLQSRGLATAACIIAMLPVTVLCCCIPGLPFGIWGLVVLNKPEVKSQFDQPQ